MKRKTAMASTRLVIDIMPRVMLVESTVSIADPVRRQKRL